MSLHWNCSGQFGGGFSWCFRCRFHWPLVWHFCQSPSGSLVGLLVGDFNGHGWLIWLVSLWVLCWPLGGHFSGSWGSGRMSGICSFSLSKFAKLPCQPIGHPNQINHPMPNELYYQEANQAPTWRPTKAPLVGVFMGALVGLLVGALVGAGAVAVCQLCLSGHSFSLSESA